MQLSGWLIFTLIVLAVTTVIFGRWFNKRSVQKTHTSISLAEMYQQTFDQNGPSREVFEKVLMLTGQAYGIDSSKLRPSDELRTLYRLDTWDVGEGTDTLNQLLSKEFGITKFESEPQSVLDLIIEVDKQVNII